MGVNVVEKCPMEHIVNHKKKLTLGESSGRVKHEGIKKGKGVHHTPSLMHLTYKILLDILCIVRW